MKVGMSLKKQIEELIISVIKNSILGVDSAWPTRRVRDYWHLDMFPDPEKENRLYAALDNVLKKYIRKGLIQEEPLCVDAYKYVWVGRR